VYALGLVLASGCAVIAGLDHTYERDEGAGGGSSTSSTSSGGDASSATGGGSGGADSSSICGNGIIEVTEMCDDGNTLDGDGCAATCQCGSAQPNAIATHDPNSGHCYVLFGAQKSFDEAEAACETENMHLASVTTLSEQKFLADALGGTINAWLGGRRSSDPKFWLWINGEPWTIYPCDPTKQVCENVNLWGMGEPDPLDDDCLYMFVPEYGGFGDRPCYEVRGYLCEWSL
jgi:cysteine-rich repeat protein